jgi:4-amino-4-deoxychorismate lyase
MTDWFMDGERNGMVSIDDRTVQYGDGLFETIAIRHDEPRLWQYHLDRLARGCECLGIAPPGAEQLYRSLQDALAQSSAASDYCVAKIIVSSGSGKRGYGRTRSVEASIWIGVFASTPPPVSSYRDGVDTKLCDTRLATGSATAGLKTLNRLDQVLARSELTGQDLFEGLTMDASGSIICGTMSNVFFVSKNHVSTPTLSKCGVEGVMRRHVIATLESHDIDVSDAVVELDDLASVDEIFITNSQFGVLPVRSCGETVWPVGETTRNVMALLAASGVMECQL